MCVCLCVECVCVCWYVVYVCVCSCVWWVCVCVSWCVWYVGVPVGVCVCLLVCRVCVCVCMCLVVCRVCLCVSSVILSCTESYKYWLWSKLLGLACLCDPCPGLNVCMSMLVSFSPSHGCWGFGLRSLWLCGRWFMTELPFPRLQTSDDAHVGSISLLESEMWWWPGIFLSPHAEEFLQSFCCLLFIRLG